MRKLNSGITLIALIISIIVLLILAGVSINALVGDNGIISQAMNASFLTEMTEVQEAFDTWRSLNYEETVVPTNGMLKVDNVNSGERLKGEIGYYRSWSLSGLKPEQSVLMSSSDFNNTFGGEIVYYPGGAQDLYWLDNKAIGLKSDNKYIIDVVNSMIYSSKGYNLNGVKVYSLNMFNAVNNGNESAPKFVEAEAKKTGNNNLIAAGNNEPEFLLNPDGSYQLDGSGNKIPNPNYNPLGFQIIAEQSNNNIYKLYNNGDLYGKGVKGNLLNTPVSEMNNLNSNIWNEFNVPSEIQNVKSIVSGDKTVFFIDGNDDLWALGNNQLNYLGLNETQQYEFTGRNPVKLNVNGEKVSKVFPASTAVWCITKTNKLYACGYNLYGELGINKTCTQTDKFELVQFEDTTFSPNNIKMITTISDTSNGIEVDYLNLILTNDGRVYFAGDTSKVFNNMFENTAYANTEVKKFIEIFSDTGIGKNFPTGVKQLGKYADWSKDRYFILDNSGYLWILSEWGSWYGGTSYSTELQYYSTNIESVKCSKDLSITQKNDNGNKRFILMPVGNGTYHSGFGTIPDPTDSTKTVPRVIREDKWYDITDYLGTFFNVEDVKDYYVTESNIFFLLQNGNVYGFGLNKFLGVNNENDVSNGFILLNSQSNLGVITEFSNSNLEAGATYSKNGTLILKNSNGKLFMTGASNLIFRDDILEVNWTKINPKDPDDSSKYVKVKKFHANTYFGTMAFIDDNNDIWVTGTDVRFCGIGHSVDDLDLPNFVRLKDYLTTEKLGSTYNNITDIYNSIDGKVEDYLVSKGSFFIKTNSTDGNKLYVVGPNVTSAWPGCSYNGLVDQDAFIPTLLLSNVKKIVGGWNTTHYALTNDGQLYIWGNGNGNNSGGLSSRNTPVNYTESYATYNLTELEDNIVNVWVSNMKGYVLTDKYFYGCGKKTENSVATGLNEVSSKFTKFSSTSFGGETVKDISFQSYKDTFFLTESGNLYGCGKKGAIGLGNSSEMEYLPVGLIKDGKCVQVVSGDSWTIIVKDDGTVWGTGQNSYGVLGRWSGVGRGESNSRYKTAFNWVECPELEN